MKKTCIKLIITICVIASSNHRSLAQVVFPIIQEFDKITKEGLYVTTAIDDKFVEKAWLLKLGEYGRVIVSRDVYTVSSAMIPAISPNPINIISRVYKQKGRTNVFYSLNVGNGEMITEKHAKYAEAKKILMDFAKRLDAEEVVRAAEKGLEDATERQEKIIKKGDKLARDMEYNGKDKEKFARKLQENAIEHDEFLKEIDQNKVEQTTVNATSEKIRSSEITTIKEKEEAQKNTEKTINKGQKLLRDLGRNQKDELNYKNRIAENSIDLEKLKLDLEQNKNDQIKVAEDVADKRKSLEAAKAKLPK